MATAKETVYVRWLDQLGSDDVPVVGGKNASLGEMVRALKDEGIQVPDGFATTADAYWEFLAANDLTAGIRARLDDLHRQQQPLEAVGKAIRRLMLRAKLPGGLTSAIRAAYRDLCQRYGTDAVDVAVRSSATAEDLPEASFAGQQETFLNIVGEDKLLEACQRCYASLFTDRAISYREERGFDHLKVALSVGVQKMVRSDRASAGVMFSIDTETGFKDVVVINAAWGLGESVVQGTVTPDEYMVFKPLLGDEQFVPIIQKTLGEKQTQVIYATSGQATKQVDTPDDARRSFVLTDDESLTLARWAVSIERYYDQPMDIEWAKDGDTGELYIVQARPETVQSRKDTSSLKTYRLQEKGDALLTGLAIGEAIAAGKVRHITSAKDMEHVEDGAVLVTEMTNPDWGPVLKRASAIVTDHGGRTCHAAIVSRELGIPAIVGTGDATSMLQDGQEVTVSCAEGERGVIYDGRLSFAEEEVNLADVPTTRTQIMMNIASPGAALRWWRMPCAGIGLARMEFIITNDIRIHPMALVHFDDLEDKEARRQIEDLTRGYADKRDYFVDRLARGIAKIAAARYPHPVLVRLSDFKTNEYADLIGGRPFEPIEENPMLGFRGAARYTSERYRDGFALECRAIKQARERIGLTNVIIMVPFCRTPEEADRTLAVLAENGLTRGVGGLEIYVMAELPSNVVLAGQFAARFDGFSIGSNDLTQFILGVDRDSADLSDLFDERHEAVKRVIRDLIDAAHKAGTKVGICGEAPSNYPDFADFLVEAGIDSISLNPDSLVQTIGTIARAEARRQT